MGFELMRIEELCQERGWSHYKLAKEMGMTANNISNLFRRSSTPSVYTLRRICDAFGITMSQFFLDKQDYVIANEQQAAILKKYMLLTGEQKRRAEAYIDGMCDAFVQPEG